MPVSNSPHLPTKIASLGLPTREAHVVASVWPHHEGTLLFLAEVNLAQPARQQLTASLTQAIEQAWSTANHAEDAERVLEQLLQQVNPTLKNYERLLGNPMAPRFHLCLGLLKNQELALSHVGHIAALVLRGQQVTSIFGQGKPRPSRAAFQHLVGGTLEPGETLLLATTTLLDYLSVEKLTHLFSLHSPGLALREVEEGITALEHHPPVGTIAVRLGELAEQNPGTETSLKQLLATQDHTSSLLKPSLLPTLWSWAKLHTPKVFRRVDEPAPYVINDRAASRTVAAPERRRSLFKRLSGLPAKFAWLRSRESIETTITWWLEGKLNTWRAQPTAKRVFLVLALLVLIAFSQSVVSMGKAKLLGLDSERYNQQVTAITENQAAIEGALIYRDDVKAQELLTVTKGMLQTLPRNTRSREQQFQALSSSLALVERRLNHTTEVALTTPWVQLPELAQGSSWVTTTLVGSTLVVSSSTGQVVLVGTDGKNLGKLQLPAGFGTPQQAAALENAVLLVSSGGNQVIVDVKGKTVLPVTKPLSLVDASSYQGRLYYLGGKPLTIYSATRSGADFGTPSRWLRSGQAEPTTAKSLTVDGALYLADGSTVQKFVRGLKRDFTVQPTTPPLQNIDTIRTTTDTDYLYLSSRSDKRVVIYDKQGKLMAQLLLPSLSDLSPDGQRQYLYLLANGELYRLKLADYTN
jgi:hypothetical protein